MGAKISRLLLQLLTQPLLVSRAGPGEDKGGDMSGWYRRGGSKKEEARNRREVGNLLRFVMIGGQ